MIRDHDHVHVYVYVRAADSRLLEPPADRMQSSSYSEFSLIHHRFIRQTF